MPRTDPQEATDLVIQWALSKPVLTSRLHRIAEDDLLGPDGCKELAFAVVELLDPERSELWRQILVATGAHVADADAVWEALGGRIALVQWERLQQALRAVRQA